MESIEIDEKYFKQVWRCSKCRTMIVTSLGWPYPPRCTRCEPLEGDTRD